MHLDTLAGDLKVSKTGLESKESKEAWEAKATKEDNAEVPIHLWNEQVLQDWSKRNNQEDAGWKLEAIIDKLLLQRICKEVWWLIWMRSLAWAALTNLQEVLS
jgi:hypothetical protein